MNWKKMLDFTENLALESEASSSEGAGRSKSVKTTNFSVKCGILSQYIYFFQKVPKLETRSDDTSIYVYEHPPLHWGPFNRQNQLCGEWNLQFSLQMTLFYVFRASYLHTWAEMLQTPKSTFLSNEVFSPNISFQKRQTMRKCQFSQKIHFWAQMIRRDHS